MKEDVEEAWGRIADVVVRHARGDSSLEDARIEVRKLAQTASLEGDVSILRILGMFAVADGLSRRAEREHKANNALAGVVGNLDFIADVLRDASPDAPLLASASREDRSNVLEALRHAVEASRKLATILRRDADDDAA